MGRRRQGERVLGPYRDGERWRVVVVDGDGQRTYGSFPTEAEAEAVARDARQVAKERASVTIDEAIDEYEVFLRDHKGNKPRSVERSVERLRQFFPDLALTLRALTPTLCTAYYDTLKGRTVRGKPIAVDTHRNALGVAQAFMRWCVKKKWIKASPLEAVEGTGRRKRGKAQLRFDEARKWREVAFHQAESGKPRERAAAVAAIMSFYMNMRASEIIERRARDVDDAGGLLWIPDSKTPAGRRQLEVPEALRPHLLRLTEGKKPEDLLFGHHWRDWPKKQVVDICNRAGVPRVTAQGMRGLHASMAAERGVTGHVIAQAMGHTSSRVTFAHYATREAVERGQQARAIEVIEGPERRNPEPRAATQDSGFQFHNGSSGQPGKAQNDGIRNGFSGVDGT